MAGIITNTEVVELKDPKLRAIGIRVAREMELAAARVAAHHADSKRFPLPSAAGVGRSTLQCSVPVTTADHKTHAAQRAISRLEKPSSESDRHFGDLAKIDLHVATSVQTQAASIGLPTTVRFSAQDIAKIKNASISDLLVGLTPQQTVNTLDLRIHEVRCMNETNPESGDDEIYLGGTRVNEAGTSEKVKAFVVRDDFDKNEKKTYSPPRGFTAFPITEGGFPKSYFVTLVLSEGDNGGLSDFINDLLDKVEKEVTKYVTAAIGAAIGAGTLVGAAIGAAVGYALGLVVEGFREWWEDDVFKPITLSLTMGSHDHRWPDNRTKSPKGTVWWKGYGGRYELDYDWRLHDKEELIRYTAAWTPSTTGETQLYDVSYATYRARYDQLWPQNWRLHSLSVVVINREPLYTAVWRPGSGGETQVYGRTYAQYRARYDELWPQKWRLKLLTRYVVGGQTLYTAAWAPGSEDETQIYDATYAQYRARYDELWPKGWRLKLIDVVNVNGEPRYTAAWAPSTAGEVQIYGATDAQFKQRYDELSPDGWRLKFISTYNLSGPRITAVWRQTKEPEEWVHGWEYDDLRARYDELWPKGWRLKVFDRYTV